MTKANTIIIADEEQPNSVSINTDDLVSSEDNPLNDMDTHQTVVIENESVDNVVTTGSEHTIVKNFDHGHENVGSDEPIIELNPGPSPGVSDVEQENEPPELLSDEIDENDDGAPWNQNNCIVCNISLENSPVVLQNGIEGNVKLKKFFLEYLGVSEPIEFSDDTSFPFCFPCAEDVDKLMALACKIEFMDLQFEKLRDTLARKTVKTYLCRNRPDILEDGAEPVLDTTYETLDSHLSKPLIHPADVLFNQWKRQYDMIIPGRYKKFPTLVKTVDPKQRISYYRIDPAGKHHFISTVNPESPVETPLVTTHPRGVKRKSSSFVVKLVTDSTPDSKRVKPVLRDENKTDDSEFEEVEHPTEDITEDDRQYKCTLCPKSFNSRSILNYHSRIHSGERPFKCNVCDKTFAQRGGLATHALVHSGEKPYHCDDCGKSFRQKYHLTQHQLIHSGLKPFSCEICHKSFNVKMNLREHMRRHTGERPYRCPFCSNSGFFRKKMLRDHIVKTHPDRTLPEDLQTLGPTPKFPKSRPTKLSPEELHRVLSKSKILPKSSEARLVIKEERRDETQEDILSLPTSTTLISIDISNENPIPQLNIIDDASTSVDDGTDTAAAALEVMEEKKLETDVNLGPPELLLDAQSDSNKDPLAEGILEDSNSQEG
ncbi:unnamed protein product [Allacma fusca]|uniref:C2H2-type domain-containing protein n=1 Tax=Allacma fusca TaxID=39272 RepID=A0A8J2L674_9HEXA|nr:unnamed protein product [Allacma fusca]